MCCRCCAARIPVKAKFVGLPYHSFITLTKVNRSVLLALAMVRFRVLGAAVLASATIVSSRCTSRADSTIPITNGTANEYDYVVVGGGLTGLVVASRLTEDPNGESVVSALWIL